MTADSDFQEQVTQAFIKAGGGGQALPYLYSKTATGALNVWVCWVEGADVRVQWGQVDGAQQQARFTCKPKNTGKANATTAAQQAVLEAAAKWVKQIKKKYHWEAAHWETHQNFKAMKAQDYHKAKNVPFPVGGQPKLDGVRCMSYKNDAGVVVLQSLGGDPYDVEHVRGFLQERWPSDVFVLDGELYCHGVPLQTIVSWVKRPQEDSKRLSYVVYDVLSEPGRENALWSARSVQLGTLDVPLGGGPVYPLKGVVLHDDAAVKAYHDQCVQLGYEGAIVRLMKGPYKFGLRPKWLLKYKEFEDAEFPVVGWTWGKGKFENTPIFTCKTEQGLTFEVVPAATEEARAEMLANAESYVGQLMTVRYRGWTEDGKPREARGKGFRPKGT